MASRRGLHAFAALVALLALAAAPLARAGATAGKSTCEKAVTCKLPAVWSEWTEKFDPTLFSAADGGWSLAMRYYLNVSNTEHWLDEYHVEAGCCLYWRCNNKTFTCEPPTSGAIARAAPLAALLAAALAALLL